MSIKYRLSTADVMVVDLGTEIQVAHGCRFFRLTHKEAGELAGALTAAVERKTAQIIFDGYDRGMSKYPRPGRPG